MPQYLTPGMTADCQCRDNPHKATFCMTGHVLECHVPMDCETAGCSRLDKYDLDPGTVKDLQERADAMLKARANPECPNCQGGGMKTIKTTAQAMYGLPEGKLPVGWPYRTNEMEVLGPCDCLEPFEQWLDRMQDEQGL